MTNIEEEIIKQNNQKKSMNEFKKKTLYSPKIMFSISSFLLSSVYLINLHQKKKLPKKFFKSPIFYLTSFLACNCAYDLYFGHFFMQKDKLIKENIMIDLKNAKLENILDDEE